MCGIAGVFSLNGAAIEDGRSRVQPMIDSISHRGPDDEGIECFPEGSLGHRRLSIIDLSRAGHQPMFSADPDRRFCIAYNGEIYNFKEIRGRLAARGVSFTSKSDTEVLLALLALEGETAISELNGLFTFALWDNQEKTLLLATDRFAIKQLYYAEVGSRLFFASEIKALLAAGVPARVHPGKAFEFQMLGRTCGDQTLFSGIRRLTPGSCLVLDQRRQRIDVKAWYSIADVLSAQGTNGRQPSSRELEERCESLLRDSIRLRLMGDAPVGVMCSGGIDSSMITKIASEENSSVTAYTARIPQGKLDESPYAARLCKELGIPHRVFPLTEATFIPRLPRAIYHNDSPLSFANSLAMFGVCDMARRDGVKVLLTGEGADEVFGGYTKYSAYKRHLMLRRFLGVSRWPRSLCLATQDRLAIDLRRFVGNGDFGHAETILSRLPGVRERLKLEGELRSSLGQLGSPVDRKVGACMLADLYDYLAALLLRQDRMGMWASIESRVPFLDHNVVEFAARVPLSHKVRIGGGKYLLRRVARRIGVPKFIIERKKQGFKGPQWGQVRRGLFDKGFCEQECGLAAPFGEGFGGSVPLGTETWRMVNLELWGRIFIWGESPEQLAEQWLTSEPCEPPIAKSYAETL